MVEREIERRQKIKERKELDEQRAKEWAEETKRSHRQAEETYEEAVKNLPDGWKQVGMNVNYFSSFFKICFWTIWSNLSDLNFLLTKKVFLRETAKDAPSAT